jgi:hypothetical protein
MLTDYGGALGNRFASLKYRGGVEATDENRGSYILA